MYEFIIMHACMHEYTDTIIIHDCIMHTACHNVKFSIIMDDFKRCMQLIFANNCMTGPHFYLMLHACIIDTGLLTSSDIIPSSTQSTMTDHPTPSSVHVSATTYDTHVGLVRS